MIKRIFSIPDMHCPACSMRVKSIEDDVEGITYISASYHKQRLEVEFDEHKTGVEQIVTAVKKKGYQAIPC